MAASLKVDSRTLQPTNRKAAGNARSETSSDFMTELGKARKEITPPEPREIEKSDRSEKPEAAKPTAKKNADPSRDGDRQEDEEPVDTTTAKPTEKKPKTDDSTVDEITDVEAATDVEAESTVDTEASETAKPNTVLAQLAIAANTVDGAPVDAIDPEATDGDPEATAEGELIDALLSDGSDGPEETEVDDASLPGAITLAEGMDELSDEELPHDVLKAVKAPWHNAKENAEDTSLEDSALLDAATPGVIAEAHATSDFTGAKGVTTAIADSALVADNDIAASMMNNSAQPAPLQGATPKSAVQPSQLPPEIQFAQANHEKIVTGISGQLMPNGGTMHIRLDPPHLGPLQVSINMRDGIVTASFETQNDDATRLLSHSLNQLKTSLEGQGITVDKLQVQQVPKSESTNSNTEDSRNGQHQGGREALTDQQNQKQRQEMLKRMWQRLNGDPLDLVA